MIPLPTEYEDVERKLRERLLTGQQASDAIHAARTKLGPPWQWKSWKKARDSVIGHNCENCGKGKEAILTLQHTFRLPRLGDSVREVKYSSDYYDVVQEAVRAVEDEEDPVMRNSCPACESTAIVYRKRAANWICNGKKNKRTCGNVFLEPSETLALSPQQKNSISNRKGQVRDKIYNERKDEWLESGILLWFEGLRRYLSLLDTKTLCKRCAFMEDKTSQQPCPSCGFGVERYMDQCPKCEHTIARAAHEPGPALH